MQQRKETFLNLKNNNKGKKKLYLKLLSQRKKT